MRSEKMVLVVDNDNSTRRAIAAALEAEGYRVSQTDNGTEALRLLTSEQPDVVVTELVLPEIDGFQLLAQLRQSGSGAKLVAMAGSSRAFTYLSVARHLGASAVLSKPFPMEELVQAVHQVFAA